MKRIFFMAVCLMAAWSLSAQMTVWSNGQSVYSHPVENVDSISFAAPTSAQVNTQQAPAAVTSLEGKVYLFARVDKMNQASGGAIFPSGFAFYSSTEGYNFENKSHGPSSTSYVYPAVTRPFTYTISGKDITITITDEEVVVVKGKMIGTNVFVLYETTSQSVVGKGAYFLLD